MKEWSKLGQYVLLYYYFIVYTLTYVYVDFLLSKNFILKETIAFMFFVLHL